MTEGWADRWGSVLQTLPKDCLPQSVTHGELSYTIHSESGCRVEDLLQGKAYYVKHAVLKYSGKARVPGVGDPMSAWSELTPKSGWDAPVYTDIA